jgi:fructose 1,6-bisphosphate aldolase/phosphatase
VRRHAAEQGAGLLLHSYISHSGGDIALLMVPARGVRGEAAHRLAWDAFVAGIATATALALYGAGQDLLKELSPAMSTAWDPPAPKWSPASGLARPSSFFAADKTDPGAFNLQLYLAFPDPMNTPGLLLCPNVSPGFRFVVMDVCHTEGDRVIELCAPEEVYDLAARLRDPERYVVESVWSRATGEQAVAVATSRLHNIAGKYTGKDDPVMLVRSQMNFPATGEILAPFAIGHFVAGCMRGSHQMPLMPVRLGSGISYFDGPPVISCAAFAQRGGRLTEPLDAFAHPFWDEVRTRVAAKAADMRRQGFFGAAMLPMSELEYTGIAEKLATLDGRFTVRA